MKKILKEGTELNSDKVELTPYWKKRIKQVKEKQKALRESKNISQKDLDVECNL